MTSPGAFHALMARRHMELGWALNLEAVLQIRGTCGERQVKDCAFAHYMAAAPVVTSIIYGRDPS
jgi:hypothetical protein